MVTRGPYEPKGGLAQTERSCLDCPSRRQCRNGVKASSFHMGYVGLGVDGGDIFFRGGLSIHELHASLDDFNYCLHSSGGCSRIRGVDLMEILVENNLHGAHHCCDW